jgi:hypothetical protein
MTKRRVRHPRRIAHWIDRARKRIAGLLSRTYQRIRRCGRGIPVEVLVSDRLRRVSLERDLHQGIRQLRRALVGHFPSDVAVVVQQLIQTDRQISGCYQVSQRPDGTRFALVRLALHLDDRPLGVDEILAALAEQFIGLAIQAAGPSVLVPIDFSPPVTPVRPAMLANRADPLAPRSSGKAPPGPSSLRDITHS